MTQAHEKLKGKIATGQCTQSTIARALGISRPSVAAWLHDGARPEPHLRVALNRIYGIPVNDWLTDAEYAQAYGCTRATAARP